MLLFQSCSILVAEFFFFGGNSSQRQVMKCAVSDKFITISGQRADQMLVTLTSRSHEDTYTYIFCKNVFCTTFLEAFKLNFEQI